MNNPKEALTINTIRILSADMVQKANSGHPGLPLGAAPMAYALYANQMRHNGKNPDWQNRDRFVLSAGHGSALLYSLLHLFGYDISVENLEKFRQFDTRPGGTGTGWLTPGHPEYKETPGVEVSTGPLGMGIANAVGMALAESHLAAVFNKPGYEIVDHYTFVLCGDGCLMQGISNEAASLAGTLGLGKLILLYDSNDISIEGNINQVFRENVCKRFEALDWHAIRVEDGNDLDSINQAISDAKAVKDKPSIIEVKTIIGYGSPNKAGKASSHGEPLGTAELALTKEFFGFDPEQHFYVPEEVKEYLSPIIKEHEAEEVKWNMLFEEYKKEYPELYEKWLKYHTNDVYDFLNDSDFWKDDGNVETRTSSERIINYIADFIPNLIGGSADLGPSNKTVMKKRSYYSDKNRGGTNLQFGAREFSMTAIANGMLVHGGLRPYIGEFFVFSDYMKAALRMSAMMQIPLIAILTHDSIGVGEDGPTHHPVEQLAALRSIPNMTVIRPADATETAAAWHLALTRKNSPTALILTRQKVTSLKETSKEALKGGYILIDSDKEIPDMILIGTGSELSLCVEARQILKEGKGIDARVVSIPSFNIFEEQTCEYREKILPKNIKKRLAVEAGTSFGWHKYIGLEGDMISVNSFGKSGPTATVLREFGFTVENVVEKACELFK